MTTPDDDMRVFLDKQAIHEVLLRYARGLDRLDADIVASAYHDDGIDDHGGTPITGRQFANETVAMLRRTYLSTTHIINNSLVDVLTAERARGETYYTAWHRFALMHSHTTRGTFRPICGDGWAASFRRLRSSR